MLASPDATTGANGLAAPILLYTFDEEEGNRVFDNSPTGARVHLRIRDEAAVSWGSEVLTLAAPTIVESDEPPRELYEECTRTDSLTVEAWIEPAETTVEGTRRILTLSESVGQRNFLLGQGGLFSELPTDGFAFRRRTTDTDGNGLPMFSTDEGDGALRGGLMHVVATRGPDGFEAIYVNGDRVAMGNRSGTFENWDPDYRIAIGDEFGTSDARRAWLGTLHLVAVYATRFDDDQVMRHWLARPTR